MNLYKGYKIHGSPAGEGGQALDANFKKAADEIEAKADAGDVKVIGKDRWLGQAVLEDFGELREISFANGELGASDIVILDLFIHGIPDDGADAGEAIATVFLFDESFSIDDSVEMVVIDDGSTPMSAWGRVVIFGRGGEIYAHVEQQVKSGGTAGATTRSTRPLNIAAPITGPWKLEVEISDSLDEVGQFQWVMNTRVIKP